MNSARCAKTARSAETEFWQLETGALKRAPNKEFGGNAFGWLERHLHKYQGPFGSVERSVGGCVRGKQVRFHGALRRQR